MRRFLPMLAVAATFVGALPAPGVAIAGDHHGGWSRGGGWEHAGGHGRGGGGGPPSWAHGGERAPPPGWRGRGGRMVAPPPVYEGPPPGAYESRGYLRRGGRLPPDVRGEVVPDPWRFRLRPPPRGYNWVRVGNAFALMNMETGQLFDIIPD